MYDFVCCVLGPAVEADIIAPTVVGSLESAAPTIDIKGVMHLGIFA